MQRAVALADNISVDTILAAHQTLLDRQAYAAPGRLRDQQVWIGSNALSPNTASFVPPHHSRVQAVLDDLIAYVHRVDLPVLVQVAIAHAQFETIHPFNDGNGRIGRTLVHAMLRHSGVTRTLRRQRFEALNALADVEARSWPARAVSMDTASLEVERPSAGQSHRGRTG